MKFFKKINSWKLKICCEYYSNINLFNESKFEIITGYFQSYRYFHPKYEALIQNEFQFLKGVQDAAKKELENAKKNIKFKKEKEKFFYIGIHIRRGLDVTWNSRNLKHGHVAAPITFYKNAIKQFKNEFANKNLIFIVASDNEAWSQKHIKSNIKGLK